MPSPGELVIKQQGFPVGDDFYRFGKTERFDRFECPSHRFRWIKAPQIELRRRVESGGLAHRLPPSATAAACADGAGGVKITSQSPPPISRSLWPKPRCAITRNSGTGLNVARRRNPWPGVSASTACMICENGSPPALRMSQTSSVERSAVVMSLSSVMMASGGKRRLCSDRQIGRRHALLALSGHAVAHKPERTDDHERGGEMPDTGDKPERVPLQ